MTATVAVDPKHLAVLRAILALHLPPDTEIWIYGSRATGQRVWRGSDLVLMIKAKDPLPLGVLAMLSNGLSESSLPYAVDLHDWHYTSAAFLHRIEADMVALPDVAAASH